MSETNTSAPRYDGSILATIKKMLGADIIYDAFDTDIIVFINTALMTLQQVGVGPANGFVVTGLAETWNDFLPDDTFFEGVKTYIYLSVKMVFDPPTSSYVMETMKEQKEELEWRLREQAELYPGDGSRKGYWEQQDISETSDGNGELPDSGLRTEYLGAPNGTGFRARGGRYASDPDFPWNDGPAQPAIVEVDGDE